MSRPYRIVALPGEGIGPEVVEAALGILQHAAPLFDVELVVRYADIGRPAWEKTGSHLPEATVRTCTDSDGVLLGGVEQGGLLELRSHFDLFVSLRPVKALDCLLHNSSLRPEKLRGVDILTVRELRSGIVFGEAGRGEDERGPYGFHTMLYYDWQIRRAARVALEHARARRGRVCVGHKENALPRIPWTRIVREEAEAFPEVEVEDLHLDDLGMRIVSEPQRFDVIVTGNLMGDWISSLCAAVHGSVGMCPSACLNEAGFGVYEGMHGTAPDIAGKGIGNPIGTLDSAVLMLQRWGEIEMARAILAARLGVLEQGFGTPDLGPRRDDLRLTTRELSDRIMDALSAAA